MPPRRWNERKAGRARPTADGVGGRFHRAALSKPDVTAAARAITFASDSSADTRARAPTTFPAAARVWATCVRVTTTKLLHYTRHTRVR